MGEFTREKNTMHYSENSPCGEKLFLALQAYYCHARRVAKGSRIFFDRFVWRWPGTKEQPQFFPHVFTCEAAEYASLSCRCPPTVDYYRLKEAQALLRQARSVAIPNFPGIVKSTMHEIAEEFGECLGQILRAVPAPAYTFDEWEKVLEDYYFHANQEADDLDWTHPEVLGEDPDSFPRNAKRVGPDWVTYQSRLAPIIEKRFPNFCKLDFDRMAADVELEYASALRLLSSEHSPTSTTRGVMVGNITEEASPNLVPHKLTDDATAIPVSVGGSDATNPSTKPVVVDGNDTTNPNTNPEVIEQYVTLNQAAAIVNRQKKSLERYLYKEMLPPPDVEGGGGKPHEWKWSRLRPCLELIYKKQLPAKFPSM